jgi:cystathionine beta-lyase/cystathionine gamma-synthase
MSQRDTTGIATRAVHAGLEPDAATGAILAPIVQSTTFVQDAVGVHKGFTYSRADNPTVAALERCLGALEDAPPSVCFSTGLAAETALFLALLRAGDHAVISDVVYGGTVRLFRQVLGALGIEASFVDAGDARAVGAAITPRTRLVFVESPGNPTLKLADIAGIARLTRAAGVPLAVDNTFLTPVLQRPLGLGADISLYSTTKYIEGHNATVGGAVTTQDAALIERLRLVRKSIGSIQSPLEAWLTLRGLKTLPLRVRRHSESAIQIARWLESDPRVVRVLYPGLESFPQRELAAELPAHGGIVSFEVKGGAERGIAVMNAVRLCARAESLGAVETLITHPATMTHGDVAREEREAAGISDGLIRLSVGLEEPEDIIADLSQALDAAFGVSARRERGFGSSTLNGKEAPCPALR